MACIHFLSTQMRGYMLAPDKAVFTAHLPSIFKNLQRIMRYDASLDVRCMVPELYYHICVISLDYPIPGITVPLFLNEFFA